MLWVRLGLGYTNCNTNPTPTIRNRISVTVSVRVRASVMGRDRIRDTVIDRVKLDLGRGRVTIRVTLEG